MLGGAEYKLDLALELGALFEPLAGMPVPSIEIGAVEATRSNISLPVSVSCHRLVLVALLGASAGCGVVRSAAHAVTPQADPPAATRWNATLWEATDTTGDTTAGPHGIAWMAPGNPDNHTIRVRVAVHHADPTQKYAWRVHFGKCDKDQGVFGPPSAYKPLVMDTTTNLASGYALLSLGFPSNGQYFVRVDREDTDPVAVVCGNLVPPR